MKVFHGQSYARDQATASDRYDHSVYVGNLLHDLEAQRSLPRYNVRIVVSIEMMNLANKKKEGIFIKITTNVYKFFYP